MPRHCSAGGCKSRDNRETRNAGITFHKLPKGTTRRSLWITNSHRTDSWDPQTDFVYFCSKHFTTESFELTGCSGIRRLKMDAFPTLFDSSSEAKRRGPGAHHKRGNNQIRKIAHSLKEQLIDQEPIQEDTAEAREVENSVRTCGENEPPEDLNENVPVAPSETPEVAMVSQQDQNPQPVSRPHSPSRYMRRLPPPPGFYLPKEHSYAQLCPLLWRKRYDRAIDNLERALQQLHAARRRENRLRTTVLRLRDKHLKHTLLVSQEGPQNCGSWAASVENRRSKGGGNGAVRASSLANQREGETDAQSEDIRLHDDRCREQGDFAGHFPTDSNSWFEEEGRYCFYCGRGQGHDGEQETHRVAKTGKGGQPIAHDEQKGVDDCGIGENTNDVQGVKLERQREKSVKTTSHVNNDTNLTQTPQVLLQTQGLGLQPAAPTGLSLQDAHGQSLRSERGCQQELLLSDVCTVEPENSGQQQEDDLQMQQVFILVPVSSDDGLLWKERADEEEARTISVSEIGFKRDSEHMTENTDDRCLESLSREVGIEFTCDVDHGEQHSDVCISSTPMEIKEDIREKLKEHLEGFHLQLSTEFIN
ncbi:THAP domain-containing protein 7 isoform X2 [Genypterus blacodes]